MRDGTLIIEDGDSNTLTLDTDEGDFSCEWGNDPRVVKQRGALSHLRDGDEETLSGTLNVKVSKIRADYSSLGGSDTDPTPYDALLQKGPASAWDSVGTAGEPYQIKLTLKIANPDTTGRREVVEIDKLRVGRVTFSEGDEYDTLAFPFTANITEPTITFEAQS